MFWISVRFYEMGDIITLIIRMDRKRNDNIEMDNGNTYPTLLAEPKAPFPTP